MPRPATLSADGLVRTALQLVSEEGLEQLTLRRVARRAGVSHGAPLRHFASLRALAGEVAAAGFRQLAEATAAAAQSLPPGAGPLARLRVACRAYVETAVANPELFALMFRPDLVEPTSDAFARDSHAAFDSLVQAVRAAQDVGFHTAADTRALAGAIWAAIHGLATLWAHGAFGGVVEGDLDTAIATTLNLMSLEPAPASAESRPDGDRP